jgi:spermidine synthase
LSTDYTTMQKVIEEWGTFRHEPAVYEEQHIRSLQFDPFAVQSSMRKGAPFELDLSYTRAMMAFQLFRSDPKDILIVGLGGGSLSKYCYDKFPTARITTVEIDERVIALREDFYIPKDSDRFRIVHADAEHYMLNAEPIADVILLDGFDTFGLPAGLSNQRFYKNCYVALRDEGVIVANLLNNDFQIRTYLQRIRTSCHGQMYRTIAWSGGNTIAFGVKQNDIPKWEDFYVRAKSIKATTGLNLTRHVRRMQQNYDKHLSIRNRGVTESVLQ